MADSETNCILVLDHCRADFESCAWSLRKMLSEIADKGFAKWVASPDRGRFIVMSLADGFDAEQAFSFSTDEDELIDLVFRRFDEMPAGGRHLNLLVTPELHRRFDEALASRSLRPMSSDLKQGVAPVSPAPRNDGERCAIAALEAARANVESLSTDDRIQWFAGFLGAGVSAMAASVGGPAVEALRELLKARR